MSRLLISTAIAGLLALSGAALAQPDDHHGGPGGGDHPPAGHAGPTGGGHPAIGGAAGHGYTGAPAAHGPAGGPAMTQHDDHHGGPGPGNAMRGPDNAMRGPAPGNAMRGPGPGGHHDYSSFHRNFSAPHHFRAPSAYNRPNGWYAHRWSYGEVLPSLFWTQNYWLSDYDDFGLMSPPPGTVWVRDGNDALLIDQYSGEIIQVEYGVFY